MTDTNTKANLKLKELGEFKRILQKTSDQFSWASDFTSFPQIREWADQILEAIEEIEEQVDRESDYIDYRLAEYDFQRALFDKEHEVQVD